MEPQSKGVTALRWLGFLPGAFLSAWVAWMIIFFGNKWTIWIVGLDSDGFLLSLYLEVLSSGAMGAAFVYGGSRIAPANRKVVAYVLSVGAVLIAGFLIPLAITQQNWWAVVAGIATVGGAGLVAYQVDEGEIDLDTHRLLN